MDESQSENVVKRAQSCAYLCPHRPNQRSHATNTEIHIKVTDERHETENFDYKTHQSDIIVQIEKFLFFDSDVCQIIHLAVGLYYPFVFTLTV